VTAIPREELEVLWDMDGYVYRCGFAADTQAKERFGEEGYLEEDYAHWAVHALNTTIEEILENHFPRAPKVTIFIGGPKNYRNKLCRTLPVVHDGWKYKGNRDALHKPKYYAELREHLVKRWNAVLSDCREADDEVSVLQYARPDRSTVIVSPDKDLRNTPGNFYNPVKKEWEYVTLKQANLNYAKQCLTGDSSDGIPGLAGIGPVKAEKLMKECGYDLERIKKETERLYINQYGPQYGRAAMHENATLLWIQRSSWVNYNGACLLRYKEEAVVENINA
jgi:hypothetical protein